MSKEKIVSEPTEEMKRRERAERILDAATDLLLRHGYKRITIDDVAKKAKVGKGTIYLHWKTREALFGTLMLREVLALWQELLSRLRSDPKEVLFHRVMRSMMLIGMSRPLGRALFTRDKELLGKLAEKSFGVGPTQQAFKGEFLSLARKLGLLRSDMDPVRQNYALRATVNGFLTIDQSLTDEQQLSLEEKAEALAETIRRTFEPEKPLPPDALHEAAAVIIKLLEQVYSFSEERLNEQME